MDTKFKRVPAADKCFGILDLIAKTKKPMGLSEISKALKYNKSTVFNIVHTLCDLGILENRTDNKFWLGMVLNSLGKCVGTGSELIRMVNPFLEEINKKIKLSAFLGIRSGLRAVIMDKVDYAFDIKIYSEVGMRLPLLAGAGGKAILSQLSDTEIDEIISTNELKKFTPHTCIDKTKYRQDVIRVREEGIAFDREEYIEGIVAFAVPVKANREGLQAAIWAVGLKRQAPEAVIPRFSEILKGIADKINLRLSMA